MYHLRLFCLQYICSTSLEIHFFMRERDAKAERGGERGGAI